MPKFKLKQDLIVRIVNAANYICNFNDELYLTLLNGDLIRLNWNSVKEFSFLSIKNVPLRLELTDNAKVLRLDESIYVLNFEFTNFMGGICVALVLNDGSAVYLVGETINSENKFQGLVAQVVGYEKLWKSHRHVAINPIYQLLTYGCKNGQAIAYYPDESTLSLQVSNTYNLNQQNQGLYNNTSEIASLKWTPDYRVLAILYENGALSLFSVFGSLIYYSEGLDPVINDLDGAKSESLLRGIEFATEGYSMWMSFNSLDSNKSSVLGELKFIKSCLAMNCATTSDHILLQSENKVRYCLNINKNKTHPMPKVIPHEFQSDKLGGNNMWQVINVPLNYMAANYPLKFVAIDQHGTYIAVAGIYGFTYYSMLTRKWKLFGNATQERDMSVTSGLLWWREHVCLGCYNYVEDRHEIRFYSRSTNLDNSYSTIIKLDCSVLKMNLFEDILILFCINCHILLYHIDSKQDVNSKASVSYSKLMDLSIENYLLGNPYCVLSIGLSELRVEVGLNRTEAQASTTTSKISQQKCIESILINVSGRLLMFQRDKSGPLFPSKNIKKLKNIEFRPPIIIASCVENLWTLSNIDCNTYMKSSLWLCCGSNGMKVWLPLSHKEDSVRFQSHRIMLNFPLSIYPLAILINEALILGITSESNVFNSSLYYHVDKTTQIYMHSLLMQLLRKNLDFDALAIAKTCRDLQHFSYILELLLHQILEQEATSSEPIPDPLLPRVVVFVNEFSEFLQIISHCTRKTDIALWSYLFVIVGNPSDLFEECLTRFYLDTAASYLIILQNTEKSSICKQHASMLLEASLKQSKWKLAKDIIRFLSSIDPNDLENDQPMSIKAMSPLKLKKEITQSTLVNQKQKTIVTKMPVLKAAGQRLSLESVKSEMKQTMNAADLNFTFDTNYIENIINSHASSLLKKYKLEKLGYMFVNLNRFSMTKWLKSELNSIKIDNYVDALLTIHNDFHWPLPLQMRSPIYSLEDETFLFRSMTNSTTSMVDVDEGASTSSGSKTPNSVIIHDCADTCSGSTSREFDDTLSLASNHKYLDYITQELANKGPEKSETQLKYLIEIFYTCECYEWVFVLSLVSKRYSILADVVTRFKQNNSLAFFQGVQDLNNWSKNEWKKYLEFFEDFKNISDVPF